MPDGKLTAPDCTLICSCRDTNPLDEEALERAFPGRVVRRFRDLCRTERQAFTAELERGRRLLVACTQEAPLFLELAEPAGDSVEVRFANIREKAGWSDEGARSGPKMAALLTDAWASPEPPGAVELRSEGRTAIIGDDDDERALEAAGMLCDVQPVTVYLSGAVGRSEEALTAPTPPRLRRFPIFRLGVIRLEGYLGRFRITSERVEVGRPDSRAALAFEPAGVAGPFEADIVVDVRSGGGALVSAAEKRDGYLRADPGDPARVMRAIWDARGLVGEFEKPRYAEIDPVLCAHSRNGVTGCTRCLDACPTGAITHSPGAGSNAAHLDPYLCAGCGTCAGICPTGAASYNLPPDARLIERARTALETHRRAGGEHPVLLVHDTDWGEQCIDLMARHGPGLPANVVPISVNSVGQCGLDFLLAAQAYGTLGCVVIAPPERMVELEPLSETIEIAEAISTGLGYTGGEHRLLLEADPLVIAEELRTFCRPGEAPLATRPAERFLPAGGKRDRLSLALSALHRHAPKPVDSLELPDGAPFGQVVLDSDRCTLCLACTSACPAGALQDDPERPRLGFQERSCVQCGLCVRTCPEQALALAPRIDFRESARSVRTLKDEEPFHCLRCAKPFGTRSTIERVVERMSGHAIFGDPGALERLRMCADCRVADMAEHVAEPFAGGPRPRTRTTGDYLKAREQGRDDPDE